ncbi:MAG TPA: HupE/UreJ family protein [Candidatus Binatia bacterium]
MSGRLRRLADAWASVPLGRLTISFTIALAIALATAQADAHNRSISYSSWELDDAGARVRARLTALDLSLLRLEGDADAAARYVAEHLVLERDGAPCAPSGPPRTLPASEGWRVFEWRVDCPSGGRTMRTGLLLDVAPSHLHFARVRGADGAVAERVLTFQEPEWTLDASSRAESDGGEGTSLAGYVLLGIEHIVSGWDHLAFVAALLLLARTLREVATLVTAFTLAHSVTLALAVLGLVQPDAAAIESLIGFSIALVAAENAWLLAGRDRVIPLLVAAILVVMAALAWLGVGALPPLALIGLAVFARCHFALLDVAAHPEALRAVVAFAFGLVHGFGFAGILAEMELPQDRLALALLGFNVGVEIGQLAVVAVVWPLLRWIARRDAAGRAERTVAELGSAAICGVGVFWFLTRAFH